LDVVCPYGAIKNNQIDRNVCASCLDYICQTKKRNEGITIKCQEYEKTEIINEVLQAKPLFFDGGGITLTGGEPTLQYQEVLELLKALKSIGIHTAIETNGTSNKLFPLTQYIDQIIIDFKHPDSEKHLNLLGLDNQQVKRNIQQIISNGKKIYIRIPLINGFNTSKDTIKGFIAFFKTLNPENFCLELLPFHEYGKIKWEQCGMAYQMDDSAYVEESMLKQINQLFYSSGFEIIST